MIEHFYPHEPTGFLKLFRHFNIIGRRFEAPAWMIVGDDDFSCSILDGFRENLSRMNETLGERALKNNGVVN